MKKVTFVLTALLLLALTAVVYADKPAKYGSAGHQAGWGKNSCRTIQSGELYASDDSLITTGYDQFGYNYQAHMFNGRYCDYDRVLGGADCDVALAMKWNDGWLANVDCDGDGLLDRHYGLPSYIGSGAWLTNHMSGGAGNEHWTYFTKIVAAPADAVLDGGFWYAADGTLIGPAIWGEFATIQDVESGLGATFVSPVGPGFGKW